MFEQNEGNLDASIETILKLQNNPPGSSSEATPSSEPEELETDKEAPEMTEGSSLVDPVVDPPKEASAATTGAGGEMDSET